MILNINGTSYEFLRKILIYGNIYSKNIIDEQKKMLEKIVKENKNIFIFNDGTHFILCREIEEANCIEIKSELTNGETE